EDWQKLAEAQLLLGQALGRDRLRPRAGAPLLAHLAADRRGLRFVGTPPFVRGHPPFHLVARVLVHDASFSAAATGYSRSPAPPEAPEENARALAARSSGETICRSKPSMRPTRSSATRRASASSLPSCFLRPASNSGVRSSRSKPTNSSF